MFEINKKEQSCLSNNKINEMSGITFNFLQINLTSDIMDET